MLLPKTLSSIVFTPRVAHRLFPGREQSSPPAGSAVFLLDLDVVEKGPVEGAARVRASNSTCVIGRTDNSP
jgi:hypothetical protein